jgi:hypothetical protein
MSIRSPLIFFVVTIIWQLIVDKEVKWVTNIGICFMMFLAFLFYNWSKIPHKWKNNNDEK